MKIVEFLNLLCAHSNQSLNTPPIFKTFETNRVIIQYYITTWKAKFCNYTVQQAKIGKKQLRLTLFGPPLTTF